MPAKKLPPIHPGEILKLEFLEPLGVSAYALANAIGVSAQQIGRVIRGKRGVSGDLALRLARYFGNSAQFWMNLQSRYELEVAQDESGKQIERRVRPYRKSAA